MPDFFVDGSPGNTNSPATYVNVGSVVIYFTSKQCSGSLGDIFPSGYVSDSQVVQSQSMFVDSFRDTALAYFATPTNYPALPTNQSSLDALTSKFGTDFYNWKLITFDYTFSGILNFIQSGLVDTYEFQYGNIKEACTTRIYTYPFNYRIHELGHYDSLNDCPNFDAFPAIQVYCRPATTQVEPGGTVLVLPYYDLYLEDGRLVRELGGTDIISLASGQACTPCVIPQINVTCTYNNKTTGLMATGTLTYQGGNSNEWSGTLTGGLTISNVILLCQLVGSGVGCTSFGAGAGGGGNAFTWYYQSSNCPVFTGGFLTGLSLNSGFSCSPLNLVYETIDNNISFTITL